MFPFTYDPSPAGTVLLHFGAGRDAHLLLPQA
jgi:hypothetical protein